MKKKQLKQILIQNFSPLFIEIVDESKRHTAHAEAQKSAGGHYKIVLVSQCFEKISLVERHRMVHRILQNEWEGSIHALSLSALTPGEWEKKKSGP